jgi:hypothetical protein
MTEQEARAASPIAFAAGLRSWGACPAIASGDPAGRPPPLTALLSRDGRVFGLRIDTASARTVAGIHVGSSRADLQRAYPGKLQTIMNQGETQYLGDASRGIGFVMGPDDPDHVVEILVGRFEVASGQEICVGQPPG